MKRYDYLFLSFGVLFSLAPIYKFFGWIYVCIAYPELPQLELVEIFKENFLYNYFDDRYGYALLALLSGVIAGVLLLFSLIISYNNKNNKILIPKLVYYLINAICTFSIVWSFM